MTLLRAPAVTVRLPECAADVPQALLGDLVRDVLRDHLGAGPIRLVALAMSKDEHPKATVLALAGKEPAPRLVVKLAVTEGASPAVLGEATVLRRLALTDPDLLGSTIPRVLEARTVDGRAALVMTACHGVPMAIDYHRHRRTASPDRVCADLACVDEWLRRLHALPTHRDGPDGEASARSIGRDLRAPAADVATRIRQRWPDDPVAARAADQAYLLLSGLQPVGSAIVHGDFWCGNVLREGGRTTGVVDWEHGTFGGDPVRDRVRFALSYALYLDRHTRPGRSVVGHPGLVAGPWGNPIRYLLGSNGWFTQAVARFVGDGLTTSGRERQRWRDAVVLGLLEIAALSDHAGFARSHLDLAMELAPCP